MSTMRCTSVLRQSPKFWATGKILLDLTLLPKRDYYLNNFSKQPDNATQQQSYYIANGGHILSRVQNSTAPEYSNRLRNLVSDCMAIDQYNRPLMETIPRATEAGLDIWKNWARAIILAQREFQLRVYYKGTEINDASPASYIHKYNRGVPYPDPRQFRRSYWPSSRLV